MVCYAFQRKVLVDACLLYENIALHATHVKNLDTKSFSFILRLDTSLTQINRCTFFTTLDSDLSFI